MITITEELIPTLMNVLNCDEEKAERVVQIVAKDIEQAEYIRDKRIANMIFDK